ncbi:MAG: peptidylprolyl isomerase [Nanoarchaeota archaeon]|jgi:FKBP-type peptidyl-prolyl cis-trans isomerase 2|nr:peptidylprolyl isomerase [Nanoarchaeota archaeon]|tara:strand:+ start:6995 stop:7627 length:633 start_codon:yes stop_codon:yes gene_type:complete
MIKNKDFIEITYTGTLETGEVFDTTDEATAKKSNIYNKNMTYGPVIICVGENQILPGLDKEIIGKDFKSYTFTLSPENAFGKKNPKLLQLLSQTSFKKQNITPYPGLQINIDNMMGTVRTVTPGRVIVDFNHPLAGKTLIYKIKILKQIKDTKKQINSLLNFYGKDIKTEIKDSNATIISKTLPKELQKDLTEKITTLIPNIKKLTIKKE